MKAFKIIIVLGLTGVFSAGVLSFFELLARNRIIQNEKKETRQAIFKIIPEAKNIEEVKDYYRVFDEKNELIGYVFLAEGQGYQGPIKILFGLEPNLDRLLGIEIISSQETPGLGAKICSFWFKEQFRGLAILPAIDYVKAKPLQSNQVQAITGATVSSRAVVNILNRKIEEVRKNFNLR